MKYTLFLFLIILFTLPASPAVAQEDNQGQEDNPITVTVTAGFDGFYKSEFWVPVHINVSNIGPAVTGELRIEIGGTSTRNGAIYSSPIDLPTQSNKRLTTYVYLPSLTSRLSIELVDERGTIIGGNLSNTLDRLNLEALLYAVVSTEANELAFLEDVDGGRGDAAVAFLGVEDLPEAPTAWNAIDVLIVHDVDSGELTAGQLEALKGWIGTGGQLVVSGGPAWQRTSAALADLLPVTISGSQSYDDLPVLTTRTGVPFRDPGPYLVTTSSLRSGELLLHQDGMPLLARQRNGRGNVYFLALDPNLAPLLDWNGSELVWAEIAAVTPRLPSWAIGAQNSYSAGTAVSSLPELTLPSAIQLFLFLFIYVIIVGPINYLVLRRMKRRELAWATIPALVLFFCIISYVTGFQLKGNDPIVNEVSIAFGRTDGEQLRVQSLLGLYSPQRDIYDVVLPTTAMARPFDNNFGGGSLTGSGSLDAVQRGADLVLSRVRVDVSDIETFVADSYQPAPDLTGEAILRLDGTNFKLEINVQNNSNVSFENVTLLIGTSAIKLGDLDPGKSESHTQTLTASQATAAAGASSGFTAGGFPVSPGSSPLARNFEVILGTSDYYNDREVYPRWQLLQAIAYDSGSTLSWYPSGVATIIAWSNAPQIDISVENTDVERFSTTLYFLELPFTQTVASGENVEIPQFLLNWQVLGENGVYEPSISDFILPPGWIEFEYQPWPEFQAMTVEGMEVILTQQNSATTRNTPRIQLWDWSETIWVTLEDGGWGRTAVEDPLNYIGPGNTVRIRLQNDSSSSLDIQDIYPLISGDF